MQEVEDDELDGVVAGPQTKRVFVKRCNTMWESDGDGRLHVCLIRGAHEVHICVDDGCDAGLMVGMEAAKRRGEDYRVR